MAEASAIDLTRRPLVAVDGTLYRWLPFHPRQCPCDCSILCAQCDEDGEPLPCEGPTEAELTWDWPEARPGERR